MDELKGLCFLIGAGSLILGLLGLVIRSATKQRAEPASLSQLPRAAAPAFPVVDGPGKFKVSGVDRETKMDTTMYVDAASGANAKVKAELEGVVVTSVDRV